jgi:hypothetical protein
VPRAAFELRQPADVVLVEMGQHRSSHIGEVVADGLQPVGERSAGADVEARGEAVVEESQVAPPGKKPGSVTDARSWPVSTRTMPSRCLMTWALMGSGLVQCREVRSQGWVASRSMPGVGVDHTVPCADHDTRVIGCRGLLLPDRHGSRAAMDPG